MDKIYIEHGTPKIIQCDRGGEFKGSLSKYCSKHGIKFIRSRPYHPQSQGKVERSHRTLRSKMQYDFLHKEQKGFNWAETLPEIQRILNEDPKQVLGYKTPFEVYFARKPSKFQKTGRGKR